MSLDAGNNVCLAPLICFAPLISFDLMAPLISGVPKWLATT